jgi:hypothetical protein
MGKPSVWPLGLFLSLLLLVSQTSAQRSGPTHPPLCPYASELAGRGRVFLRCWYGYEEIMANQGGYREFTAHHFWDNFTVTDVTSTYPAPQGNGKTLPPPGNYATSRIQFSDIHERYIPDFLEVFNYTLNGDLPSYGYRDEKDCLTYKWESSYVATLLKPYG